MRTKDEIMENATGMDVGGVGTQRLLLEVLIDIRDLLQTKED